MNCILFASAHEIYYPFPEMVCSLRHCWTNNEWQGQSADTSIISAQNRTSRYLETPTKSSDRTKTIDPLEANLYYYVE